MSERVKLPEVPASALRDAATGERLDRVWRRLDGDLSGVAPRSLRSASVWIWAPAAAVAMFALGVFVGVNWVRTTPSDATALKAEPLLPPAGPPASPEVLQSPTERRHEPLRRGRFPRSSSRRAAGRRPSRRGRR